MTVADWNRIQQESFDADANFERLNHNIDTLMAARLDSCFLNEEGLGDCAGPVEVRFCGHLACENHTDEQSVCLACSSGLTDYNEKTVRMQEADERRWDA